jgi:hypothetical protein
MPPIHATPAPNRLVPLDHPAPVNPPPPFRAAHSVPGTKFPPVRLLRYYFNQPLFNHLPPGHSITREWEQEAPKLHP